MNNHWLKNRPTAIVVSREGLKERIVSWIAENFNLPFSKSVSLFAEEFNGWKTRISVYPDKDSDYTEDVWEYHVQSVCVCTLKVREKKLSDDLIRAYERVAT